MKIAITIIALVVTGAALVYTYFRSKKQRASDEIYAELKALQPIAKDFTTPEGAILCLEDAYRRRDIEAAIAAKDFMTEARLMLETTGFKEHIDDEMIAKTAEALILSFRAHTTAKWPDFDGIESFFTKREPHSDKVVVVTEVCRFPDRGFSTQHLLVSETADGWRVLNPISLDEGPNTSPTVSKSDIKPVQSADAEMNAVMQTARDRFPEFWREVSADYKRVNPTLGGSMVKAYFDDPGGAQQGGEHMWVRGVEYDGKMIIGELADTPRHLRSVKAGQQVSFPLERLSDWFYVDGDKAVGAFTVKLLRTRMTDEERRAHDSHYPFRFE